MRWRRRTPRRTQAWLGLLAVGGTTWWAAHHLRRYEIADRSMRPTLSPGDYVIASNAERVPWRADIVIFEHPERPRFELVKRIVGLPGETVSLDGGTVRIDGAVLYEPWIDVATPGNGTWTVPQDAYFVMGDNRSQSRDDSRTHGPVPASAARWRVALRYWPAEAVRLF